MESNRWRSRPSDALTSPQRTNSTTHTQRAKRERDTHIQTHTDTHINIPHTHPHTHTQYIDNEQHNVKTKSNTKLTTTRSIKTRKNIYTHTLHTRYNEFISSTFTCRRTSRGDCFRCCPVRESDAPAPGAPGSDAPVTASGTHPAAQNKLFGCRESDPAQSTLSPPMSRPATAHRCR
jgi:hypothetical protein